MYYIVRDGKPYGPLTLEELKSFPLKGTDFVKPPGKDDYKELREWPQLCEELGITYERALPQYYATLDMRLLAGAIDYFFAFLIYALAAVAIMIEVKDAAERIQLVVIALGFIPLIKFLINSVCEGSSKNASPGKLLLHIKVTDERGNPIGLGRSFWRNIAKITGVLTLGLGFLYGFFNKKQQCLHDKLAHTLVIKERLL